MDRPLLVDTDVLVDFLRGHDRAVAYVKQNAERMILSSVVVAELYAGVRDGRERQVLDEFVLQFRSVPVTREIAMAGGLLKRQFAGSHGIGLADALIAASARVENAEFCTLNVAHYPMFGQLQPPYAKR